jgi:Uncharacterized conserved protein
VARGETLLPMSQNQTEPPAPGTRGNTLSTEFVALVRCPNCPDRPPLDYDAEGGTLTCTRCGRVYPVVDGLPDLRADETTDETPPAREDA